MAEFPIMPIMTDAYLGDTRHLNAAQHGAYFLLLITAWRTHDCAIPDDDEKLARWAAMDRRTWLRNKSTVMAFWELGEDAKWRQAKQLEVRQKSAQLVSQKSVAGSTSALKRKERRQRLLQQEANRKATNQTHNQESNSKELDSPPVSPTNEPAVSLFPEEQKKDQSNAKPKPAKRPTRFPDDWKPNASHRTRCLELGFDCDDLARQFENWHIAKGSTFADWDRAFWTWIDKEKNGPRRGGSPRVAPVGRTTYADSIRDAGQAALDNITRQDKIRKEMGR